MAIMIALLPCGTDALTGLLLSFALSGVC